MNAKSIEIEMKESVLREKDEQQRFYKVERMRKRVPAWFVEYVYSIKYTFNKKTKFWRTAVKKYTSVERQVMYIEYNLLYLMYIDFLKKKKELSKDK